VGSRLKSITRKVPAHDLSGRALGNEPDEPPGCARRPEPGKAGTANHDKTTRLFMNSESPYSTFNYILYLFILSFLS
jgi:hypothetical protein